MKGLVQKPQFDPQVFLPGRAVKVTCYNWATTRGSYARDALIVECDPIYLKVMWHDPDHDKTEWENCHNSPIVEKTIHVDSLNHYDTKHRVTIEFLKPETE